MCKNIYAKCEKLTRSAKCEKCITLNVKTSHGKNEFNLNTCACAIVRLLRYSVIFSCPATSMLFFNFRK